MQYYCVVVNSKEIDTYNVPMITCPFTYAWIITIIILYCIVVYYTVVVLYCISM